MFHSRLVFDKNAVCQSRVCDDFQRVVNYDEKGNEHITFEKVDYRKLQDSLGSFDLWSLKSLISAGIDPSFGIKTGFNTRLDGLGIVESAIDQIDNVVNESEKSE